MKTAFRTRAAALALALPLAGAFVTEAAVAQERVAVPQAIVDIALDVLGVRTVSTHTPVIERFVVHGDRRVQAGRELRFRLHGASGGRAFVEIPGVVRGVSLTEARPGIYEGSYTLRRRDDLARVDQARATLQLGREQVSAVAAIGPAADNRAPRITSVTPSQGERLSERGRAEITARFDDAGSGVNPRSVRLIVDGRDVTDRTEVQADAVRFRDNLPVGLHTAELVVSDRSGNTTRKSWNFRITDRRG